MVDVIEKENEQKYPIRRTAYVLQIVNSKMYKRRWESPLSKPKICWKADWTRTTNNHCIKHKKNSDRQINGLFEPDWTRNELKIASNKIALKVDEVYMLSYIERKTKEKTNSFLNWIHFNLYILKIKYNKSKWNFI